VRERNGIESGACLAPEHLNEAIEENVLQQVQHMRTHPIVAAKLATKKVQIHGWVYNIESGRIRCCDQHSDAFTDFDEHYRDDISRLSYKS
jgi:carbonic anhydrase